MLLKKGQTWTFNTKTASAGLCDFTVEAGTKTGRAGGSVPAGPPTEYCLRAQPWRYDALYESTIQDSIFLW